MPIWLLVLLGGVAVAAVASKGKAPSKKPNISIKPGGSSAINSGLFKDKTVPFSGKVNYPMYSIFSRYTSGMDTLPLSSPTGSPWVLWSGSTTAPFEAGMGLDRDGRWWIHTREFTASPFEYFGGSNDNIRFSDTKVPLTAEEKKVLFAGDNKTFPAWHTCANAFCVPVEKETHWLDSVSNAAKNYMLPIMAAAIAAIAPGVGGILAGAALAAIAKMSEGAKITDAVVAATRDSLPSLTSKTEFAKAYDLLKKNVPLSTLNAAWAKLATPQAKSAFDAAIVFENAKRSQLSAVDKLKKQYPYWANNIQYAFDHGAKLEDIATAIDGEKAVVLMNKAIAATPKIAVAKK